MELKLYHWLIIAAAIVAIILLVIILYKPIRKLLYKKRYVQIYYKDVYKVAKYEDYYLINNLILEIDPLTHTHVDHILFANRYIYVINDLYFDGEISGKARDEKWIFTSGKKNKVKKEVRDNLFITNRDRIEKIALITMLDPELFISVIIANNDLNLKDIEVNSKSDYIIHRRDLYKLVNAIESRPVAPMKEDELAQAVLDIDKLNLRHELKKGKKK